jgi:hypothetical protein
MEETKRIMERASEGTRTLTKIKQALACGKLSLTSKSASRPSG